MFTSKWQVLPWYRYACLLTQCGPIQIQILSLTRGLQGAIRLPTEIYDKVMCSLQGCTSNRPARAEK